MHTGSGTQRVEEELSEAIQGLKIKRMDRDTTSRKLSHHRIVKDMESGDEIVPVPIACRQYSGKFMVRVPPAVHRNPAIRAAESGISLNRVVSSKLSQ